MSKSDKSKLKQLHDPDVQLTTPELELLIWGTRDDMLAYLCPRMPNDDRFWGENWKWLRDMSTERLRQMLPYHAHWSAQPWTREEVETARIRLKERHDAEHNEDE